MLDREMHDRKMQDQMTGDENAGYENTGPYESGERLQLVSVSRHERQHAGNRLTIQ